MPETIGVDTDISSEYILIVCAESKLELYPTQKRLCLPIIRRIYQKMKMGIRFDDIKVSDNLIIDGHHRFISGLLVGIKPDIMPAYMTSATIKYDWSDVVFVNEEWDTPEKIAKLNHDDAEFNNIPIEELEKMLK
jgi:hypothetical protein